MKSGVGMVGLLMGSIKAMLDSMTTRKSLSRCDILALCTLTNPRGHERVLDHLTC